jgi:hypothetical protein
MKTASTSESSRAIPFATDPPTITAGKRRSPEKRSISRVIVRW